MHDVACNDFVRRDTSKNETRAEIRSLEGDESGGVGGTDTGATVLDGAVRA